ncbi:MAG: outer membrane beta-barrel protein [Gemmatimonadaceae bacterium]|nr:outer membrane beta-barrel protein [Gemmatimonadaceae bacterium]
MKRLAFSLALLALGASVAGAQVTPKRFAVVTRLGVMSPEKAASQETAGLIGLDAEYALNKYFGLGTALDIGHGNSRREDFIQRLRFGNPGVAGGDTIYYQQLGQPVNTLALNVIGTARIPGKISPYAVGGVGTYLLVLDAQANGASRSMSGLSYTGGAGVNIQFNEKYGVQFDVRALQFQDFKRSKLDPSDGRFLNVWFPEDLPVPPAAKNSVLNTTFTLGFRYVPQGGN